MSSNQSRSPQSVVATLVAVLIGTAVTVGALALWRSAGSPGFAALSWWRILIVTVLAGTAVTRVADQFAAEAPTSGWAGYRLLMGLAVVVATVPLLIFRREGWFLLEAFTAHVLVASSFAIVVPLIMRPGRS